MLERQFKRGSIMTLREVFDKKWVEEGFLDTDDRKEECWNKTIMNHVLRLGDHVHMVIYFPDYTLEVTGEVV